MGYPKEVHQRAWAIMDSRREESREESLSHRLEARAKIPELVQIEEQMAVTAAGITKAVVVSPEKAGELVEQLGLESEALQRRRAELLTQHGYPADYLKERYRCTKCEDTGYIGPEMCDCFQELLKQQAAVELGSVMGDGTRTFGSFRLDYYPDAPLESGDIPRKRMEDIYNFCHRYAETFSKESENLLLMGRTGLGKTHLSLAIAGEVTARGFGVIYTPVQRLMDRLEANKFSYDQSSKERYSQDLSAVLECDLLILDDLGTEFSTSFTTSTLYNIINSRMVEGYPTIVSTNLELSAMESQYSQRMASRLGFGYKILRFYGEDVRYKMLEERHRRGEKEGK